jgi:hypothetical protein
VKILIAAASFASNMSGLQRHALNVARCLLPETGDLISCIWSSRHGSAALLQDCGLSSKCAGNYARCRDEPISSKPESLVLPQSFRN